MLWPNLQRRHTIYEVVSSDGGLMRKVLLDFKDGFSKIQDFETTRHGCPWHDNVVIYTSTKQNFLSALKSIELNWLDSLTWTTWLIYTKSTCWFLPTKVDIRTKNTSRHTHPCWWTRLYLMVFFWLLLPPQRAVWDPCLLSIKTRLFVNCMHISVGNI